MRNPQQHWGMGMAAAVLVLAARPAVAQTKYALLIGIQHYAAAQAPPAAPDNRMLLSRIGPSRYDGASWEDLDGSLHDVAEVRALLTSPRFGFAAANVHVLPEAQATHAGILAAMRTWLVDKPAPSDIVIFYYAGHGSRQFNSLSNKPFNLDNTIVPVDAAKGARDVRDQEIYRIFNAAVDKKVRLTAIFDSCNSGSIARGLPLGSAGKVRELAYDPTDAHAAPDSGPRPEDRAGGAIVFSAAQADESASEWKNSDGTHDGAFTAALLQTLNLLPPDAPAQAIYERVSAILDAMPLAEPQQPALAGVPARLRQPLFGAGGGRTGLELAVRALGPGSDVTLGGGLYQGVGPGTELAPAGGDTARRIKVVRNLGADLVEAAPVGASTTRPGIGDLFDVTRLVPPPEQVLPVWMPPQPPPAAEVAAVAATVASLARAGTVTLVDDPLFADADWVLDWNGSWRLRNARHGRTVALGAAPPGAAKLRAALAATAPPQLFFDAPPTPELEARLRRQMPPGLGFATDAAQAMYLLTGRWNDGQAEFTWMRPNVAGTITANGLVCSTTSSFPPRSAWKTPEQVDQLSGDADALSHVKLWLELPAPAADAASNFPYHLEVYDPVTGAALAAAPKDDAVTVADGHEYGLRLVADGPVPPDVAPRWVYVGGIGCDGGRWPFYPVGSQGNLLPTRKPGDISWPTAIPLSLTTSLKFTAPDGLDTLVLLATPQWAPITDFSQFTAAAVGLRAIGAEDPLDAVEHPAAVPAGAATRNATYVVQYLRLRSSRGN